MIAVWLAGEVALRPGVFCKYSGAPFGCFPAAPTSERESVRIMERSVKSHIEELKLTVLQLNDRLMQEDDVRVRNLLESRARAADDALEYFLLALQLEQKRETSSDLLGNQ